MAIINVPSNFTFSSINKFKLDRSSLSAKSRYNAKPWVQELPFAVWTLDATLRDYDGQEANEVKAFFVKLKGKVNTFRLPVPEYNKPSSGYAGNVDLKTAALAQATAIVVKNGIASASFLKAGEYFTIQDELKMVTEAVNLNGSGEATIVFEPALRADAAANILITIQNPTVLLRAMNDDIANWGVAPPLRHKLKLEAEEAI